MPFPSFLDARDRTIFTSGKDRLSQEFVNDAGFQVKKMYLFDFYDPIQYIYALLLRHAPNKIRAFLDPFYLVVGLSELILNDGLNSGHQEISDLVYAELISERLSPEELDAYASTVVDICSKSMDIVYDKIRFLVSEAYIQNHTGYLDYHWHFAFRFSPYVAQFNLLKQI